MQKIRPEAIWCFCGKSRGSFTGDHWREVKKAELKGDLITPIFKDEKNGKYKIISFYAKKARGMMADFIVREGIKEAEDLTEFTTGGYKFSKKDSSESDLVFLRKEQG